MLNVCVLCIVVPPTLPQVLEDDFLPYFKRVKKSVGLFDNAKPHIAGTTKGFFFRMGLKKIKHCPNSPDFNCIELVWQRMVEMMRKNLPWVYVSRDTMIKEIRRAWLVQASAVNFSKDVVHIDDNMRKSMVLNGGNMYNK